MKVAHSIIISVFADEEEDSEKIKQKLIEIIPFDLEKDKIKLEHKTATGAKDNKIEIFEIRLEKEKHIKTFMQHLKSKLTQEQKELLIRQLDSRVDEECHFFLRFDKEKMLENEWWITESGNCYHIKILLAAYPAKKEKAIKIIKEQLQSH